MFDGLPLAAYLRPKKLDEVVGQELILKSNGWLLEAIKNDRVPSLIFWGPPGTGKTTLASLIAQETKADFIQLSATESGVKDLKAIVEKARSGKRLGVKTILFIDEIHRWNKSQQDALLPQVENGVVTLIGATTENPSFAVNGALLSRVKVVVLEALNEEALLIIVKRAAKTLQVKIKANPSRLIARLANGDARRAIGLVETAAAHKKEIEVDLIKEIINKPNLLYDKSGEEHYNLISALHKSMRGNDENAALYYLARMLEAGEDPLYIARRLVRFASEDVGIANNSALLLTTAVYDACKNIGMPECGVHLAHAVTYLSKTTKNIDVYQAFNAASAEVRESGNLPVPLYLRNAPTKLMKNLGYGKNYKYTPLEDDSNQEYLPEALRGRKFFRSKR
ncbi:MAG: replication-associated recombination protein A [Patescibacteria group bacterium]|nr:replication-associated recombination protein A [Patescibacteria group bacterium]